MAADDTGRTVIAYRLTPVYARSPQDPPQLASAALMTCLATGRTLSHAGGGGLFLTPAIVDAMKNDGRSKMVVLSQWHDGAVALLREARAQPGVDPDLARRIDAHLAED